MEAIPAITMIKLNVFNINLTNSTFIDHLLCSKQCLTYTSTKGYSLR